MRDKTSAGLGCFLHLKTAHSESFLFTIMPGIVGLVTKKPRQWAETQLRFMVESMRHDNSYVSGTWIDDSIGIYVGWTARPKTFASEMPVYNESRSSVLIFSGEEYPDPQIHKDLKNKGHICEDRGPSYLVHISESDPSFPRGLNGRFHGVLIDKETRKATLFNDRYGMHRVYYHESADAFFFAAETKAILRVLPELRRVDRQGLSEFAACGCVLEDRTIFKDIRALPIGSAWIFSRGKVEKQLSYFRPSEWEEQESLDPESYYLRLKNVFSANLSRYFGGEERVGVSLTGGLDTRMIMAWTRADRGLLPSYTFGGPMRECQDVMIARRVARVCDQPYEVIPVDEAFLSRFGYFAERAVYLSDGCAAVNRGADLYVNQHAAAIAPVRMTGNYGSEILRRLRVFKPSNLPEGLFQPEFHEAISAAKETYRNLIGGHAVSFTAFRQAPWYQHGLLALEETQLTMRSPFLDNDLVQTAFRAPKSNIVKKDVFENNSDCARLIADGNPALNKIPTDRGLGGAQGWTGPISRRFLEFTFKAEYAYDYGMPQWLARVDHGLSALHLERLFLGRHKFCHFRLWYRDNLSGYVREMLLDSKSLARPYIEKKKLERIVLDHIKGIRNYTTEITRLLTLELQHRLFIDA